MRLSGLVIAVILICSTTLLAQHSSGGGGSSSGGSSHSSSSSSGSFSSSGSSHVSSVGGSHSGGASSSTRGGSAPHDSAKNDSAKKLNVRARGPESASLKAEKKGLFSFLRHHKAAPNRSLEAATKQFFRCKKGENCTCIGRGSRNHACGSPVQSSCLAGQTWNGLGCGTPYWLNNCRALAQQLEAERLEMQGQVDPGQDLRYQRLQEQYDQCMRRFGADPFSAYLFDTP